MRIEIICELATNHGGDMNLACEMIAQAVDAGADTVKVQSYQVKHLSPRDPQYDWLRQCELSDADHEILIACCVQNRVQFLTTVFCKADLERVLGLGVRRVKIGHGESSAQWWRWGADVEQVVSWPWGGKASDAARTNLSVVPIYPTPLEALTALILLDGYSDHSIGTTAAKWAMAKGARVIEVHFSLPGRGRVQTWDKTPYQIRELREWADQMAVIQSGTKDSERWTHTPTA